MNYYDFTTNNYENYGVQGYATPSTEISFICGEKITEDVPLLTFEVNFPKGYKLPQFLGDVIPIISNRLLDVLNEVGVTNIQTYPVVLQNSETGEVWNNYHALNVIGLVYNAVDIERSNHETIMEGSDNIPALLAFEEIVLIKNKIPDLLMFRIAESPSTIIAHEKILDQIATSSYKGWGIDFTELETV
ncbi:hypothetical protein P3G55_07375 [Leptospira sp. 96542]|nr:hypothetical protein [Leptospira sp. 96542]